MTGRRRLGLVAASATLLAAAPLSAIFETWSWLLQCVLAVGLVAGAAVLARTLRFPAWAQALGMIGVLLTVLTWMFSSGDEIAGVIPTPATFENFAALAQAAGEDTRSYGVPVPDREGLLFITVLGVASCAIIVDLCTVVLRRPALAGLPMLAIYSVPVAVYVDSVPAVPFVIGAVGFLWLLVADNIDQVRRFGRRFTGDGRDVDVWEPSPLAAAGRRLAVVGVAAAVLLPLAVPTFTGGLLSRLTQVGVGGGEGNGLGGGGSGRINLFASLSGELTQSNTRDMLRVTTDEEDPFYLRIGVADQITEQGMANRAPSGRPLSSGLPDPREQPNTDEADYRQYRATVEILNLDMGLAPVYSSVVDTSELNGSWSYDSGMQSVYSARSSIQEATYSFDYVRASYTPDRLRTAQPLDRGNPLVRQFTAVPADETVEAIVADRTRGAETDYDKVRALYDFFSADNGFSYSLSTEGGTSGSEIAAFLTNKQGYCQQYAAALTWLVRAAGIPARVAFGFTRGTADGDSYLITNRNAHAWTEVYLDGFGWVPFDATPAAGVTGSARSEWAPDSDAVDPAPTSTGGTETTPETDTSAAPGTTAGPDRDVDAGGPAGVVQGTPTGPSTTTWFALAGAALLLALLAVPALRRSLVRRRRHHATEVAVDSPSPATGSDDRQIVVTTSRARADAHAAWDELIDTMIDFRVAIDEAETPRHTAQRLIKEAELTDQTAASAELLGRAEERARYARQPLQGGELTEALVLVRRGLAARATRRERFVAAVMPPSVMLRWRLGMGRASGRTMEFFSRLRDRLIRFSPRRLVPHRK